MKKFFVGLNFILFAILLPVNAVAQIVLYEQATLNPSDRGAYQYYNQQLADDFVPIAAGQVSHMTWQGSYYGTDNPAATESFTIQFFTDLPGLPETVPFFETIVDAPKTPIGTLSGKPLYEYSIDLPAGPTLALATTYWVNIYTNDSPSNYAWANSSDGTPDGAIRSEDNAWGPLDGDTRSNHVFSLYSNTGLYGIARDEDTLVKIDLTTYAATTVGSLGTDDNFGGLAFDANSGIMYMSGGRGNNSIYTVDYTTGAATLLGAHGIGDVFGLAFDTTNNILYGTTTTGQLYSFSQSDGSATLIGTTGFNLGGVAYDALRDRLIALATGGQSAYELNRSDGSATLLQANLPFTNDTGFTYDTNADVFYSLGLNGTLHEYSATDFAATLLASGLPPIDGLTYIRNIPLEVPMADLTISKLDDLDPVVAGTNLTYTLRVDNIGDAVADDVVVTDVLPAGLTLVSTTGCAEDSTGAPTCSLGSIAASGFAEFTITVTVDPSATGTLVNTATVVTSSAESDTDNNSAEQTTAIIAEADLSITKMDSSDPIVSGGNHLLVYTIEVSNAGPSDATNVVVTDTLPSVALFQSTSGCLNDPNGVPDCQLGTIPAGDSASYTITVKLLRAGGVISNTVSVNSDAVDPTPENDSVEEMTEVFPIAIPTLSTWGLMMMILLLASLGWVAIRRT